MPLLRYHPAAPLGHYAECLWWSRRDAAQLHWEHMLPSGKVHLVIALHEHPLLCLPSSSDNATHWSGAVVHGPQSAYYVAGPKPAGAVVGVSFRAGAAGAVLGIPVAALTDRHLSLEDLWGQMARTLREQLMAAPDPATLFRLLEQNLTRQIEKPLLMHPAVAQALFHRAPWSSDWISQVRQASGYSPRHFIALFRSAVGLTPKHFQRIQRFNQALQFVVGAERSHLADVGARCGYADQAHLSREFSQLAGISPSQYQPRPGSPLHHESLKPPTCKVKNIQDRRRE